MDSKLIISSRFYSLEGKTAVTNHGQVFAELVTNCMDAYSKCTKPKIINIHYGKEKRFLIVTDNAIGMTEQEMIERIQNVGTYTSDENSRGIMGRGSKDIANLGNVSFGAIKDDVFVVCTLDKDLNFGISPSIPAANYIRKIMGIPENGFEVSVNYIPGIELPEEEDMRNILEKEFTLRNVLSNDDVTLNFNGKRVKYVYPEATNPLKYTFMVPGYSGVNATFELFVTSTQIPNPQNERMRENGILVQSNNTIYEVSFLDYGMNDSSIKYNKYAKYVYGKLTCNFIDTLIRQHALLMTIPTEALKRNPYMMIDPSRNNGLSKTHPFVKALFEIPQGLYQSTISRLMDKGTASSIIHNGVSELFSSLGSDLAKDLLPEKFKGLWRSKSDSEVLKKAIDQRVKAKIDEDFYDFPPDSSLATETIRTQKDDDLNRVVLQLFHDTLNNEPCEIVRLPGKTLIRVNTADPSIISLAPNIETIISNGEKIPKSVIMGIASVIRMGMTKILTRQKIITGNIEGVNPDIYNKIHEIESESISVVGDKIYSSMASFVIARKNNRNN